MRTVFWPLGLVGYGFTGWFPQGQSFHSETPLVFAPLHALELMETAEICLRFNPLPPGQGLVECHNPGK